MLLYEVIASFDIFGTEQEDGIETVGIIPTKMCFAEILIEHTYVAGRCKGMIILCAVSVHHVKARVGIIRMKCPIFQAAKHTRQRCLS
ncbi:hypothetical protein A4R29_20610 [Mesorhizobium ciceri biovar biserrulae]|nr:hypothetical protein A4R29_20610 [Mesorhizobium ciceri biovar biserrulae]